MSVGKGIIESGVEREKIFVTSKVWNTERGYETTKKAFDNWEETVSFCKENDILPLPKSVTPSRIIDNMKVFDFVITEEDMQTINGFSSFIEPGADPDEVDF